MPVPARPQVQEEGPGPDSVPWNARSAQGAVGRGSPHPPGDRPRLQTQVEGSRPSDVSRVAAARKQKHSAKRPHAPTA